MPLKKVQKSIHKYIHRMLSHRARVKKVRRWEANGKPVPPPNAVKQQVVLQYKKKYSLDILIETGTFYGQMCEAMKNHFDRIYTIELGRDLYEKARHKFRTDPHIELIHGDSGQELPVLLKNIHEPALFWLDGHYSAGVTAKGDLITPISLELEAILNHPVKEHVILIDDARDFDGTRDYPDIDELIQRIQKEGTYSAEVKDDIIRLVPRSLSDLVDCCEGMSGLRQIARSFEANSDSI